MAHNDETAGANVLFAHATRVERLDSHTYRAQLSEAYCAGAVPNGGYAASCMLAAASTHLSTRDQPDMLTAHFEYPYRAFAGPAIIRIEDVKLSGQVSSLQLTLWQDGLQSQAPWVTASVSRRCIIANTTHTNLRSFEGISLPTGYETTPAAELPPMPDFDGLKSRGADDTWEEQKPPLGTAHVRTLRNWLFYVPRKGPLTPGVLDMWIRTATGEHIKQGALAYVADSFPFTLHQFLAAPELRKLLEAAPSAGDDNDRSRDVKAADKQRASLWFPTLVMNLESKTALPDEGAEWLAVRVTSKHIRDGRFDLEVLVRDVEGEAIMLSHHVAMILSMERNLAKTTTKGGPKSSL